MQEFELRLLQDKELVEKRLNEFFTQDLLQKRLFEAMRYSLLAGGKRIRPVLALEFCRACGKAPEIALDAACSLEMLHSYSLIHDDLPCMDNDSLRRGLPTNHTVYGEWLALLAGDALASAAFETVLNADLPPENCLRAARALARAAGELGICGGQYLDMETDAKFSPEAICDMKTAALIVASAQMGCAAAGASEAQMKAAEAYGKAVGLAFQLRDDLLDISSSVEVLGKDIGSDEKNGKNTFVSIYGIAECEKLISEKTEEAKSALDGLFEDTSFLKWLADYLAGRIL